MARISQLAHDIDQLPKDDGWRDIENAPRDGTKVLLSAPPERFFYGAMWVGQYQQDPFAKTLGEGDLHWNLGPWKQPTKWQPLPPPPEGE